MPVAQIDVSYTPQNVESLNASVINFLRDGEKINLLSFNKTLTITSNMDLDISTAENGTQSFEDEMESLLDDDAVLVARTDILLSTEEIEDEEVAIILDADGDGYDEDSGDCDDGNLFVYPGAPETYDSIDNNCNGSIDEGLVEYAFVVGGHPYRYTAYGLHPDFVAEFPNIRDNSDVKFVILTGDIAYRGNEEEYWNAIVEELDTIGKPYYFAVGNHDVYEFEGSREYYEGRFGDTYYSFDYNGDYFIVLDPNLDGWNISGDQLDFLEDELTNLSEYNNVFVFFHQLIWWDDDHKIGSPNSTSGRSDTVNFWTDVEPLFNNLPQPVIMFAGDVGASHNGSEYLSLTVMITSHSSQAA